LQGEPEIPMRIPRVEAGNGFANPITRYKARANRAANAGADDAFNRWVMSKPSMRGFE